ncbi:MAG TPA: phosphoethanolamine--lipid A transferase [Steroidobacteraceae bacterium]|nr:phosphoethanolamine--lipid A transferase [Steroidobacteraceae bacterium]
MRKSVPAHWRPLMRLEVVLLAVLGWMLVLLNGPWWSAAMAGRDLHSASSWLFAVCTFISLLALHFALIAPLANRWTMRPLLSVLIVVSAAAAYYMRTYAVLIDPVMMRNVLETDAHEAGELITASMFGWVLLWSAAPLTFIWWVRIERRPWLRASGFRAATVLGALVLAVVAALPVNRDLTSMMRNHREMRYLVTPGNIVWGLATSSAGEVREAAAPRAPIGRDARLMRVALAPGKHRVFVLVIGETARADNFSVLGYGRPTTPELAKIGVTAFSHVTSCGTSTEVSVPCLFSEWGREEYDERRIRSSEGLLDVLAHAGYAVQWFDNQSGCKGVCKGQGVRYEKLAASLAPDLCRGDECWDGILVRRLQAELADLRQDTVIVLHMMGNHGPAYFLRYPPAFRRFTPDCATAELRDCTREQVVNAYDNAILYTDHVLAGVVQTLQAHEGELDSAMLYVSDHGESLGEGGLYLHGLPYSIAPGTQTHVPMIAWMSPGFSAEEGVSVRCLSARRDEALSHDNVFHSVLGLMDVKTEAYKPERDVFADCRQPPARAYARATR